ncbi:GmrSD restriction endonuclease domain-containing protein [Williamsia sp. M5A3_1d]
MKAEALLLRELFEGEQCLVVPVFQRPYVWTRTRNWEPLWNDIVEMADRFAADVNAEPHFLGAVVLDATEKDSAEISVRQVIDGQQRVTTLQIALCAVRDAMTTTDVPPKFVRVLRSLTGNDEGLSDADFAPFKVWPTLRDRAAFQSIVNGDDSEPADSRLRDAYDYFLEACLGWLEESRAEPERVAALVKVLRTGLQLVVIELSATDNAQVIFESLNDRGTPLLPSDLVKNSLFQLLERSGADVEQVFDDHWRRLETDFWREEIRQGRLIRSRLDAFFAHYLTMCTGNEILSTELFTAFKTLTAESSRDELIARVRDIAANSEAYRRIIVPSAGADHQKLMEVADALDTSVLAPVVLYLEQHADSGDRSAAYAHIESWLVRRAVLRSTSKNYNRMLLDLLKTLRDAEAPFGPMVEAFLLSNTSESGRWPTDDEMREVLISSPLYKNLTRARSKLVLRGCEAGLLLATGTGDEPPQDSFEVAQLSVGDDGLNENLRGSLGNLGLVASPRPRGIANAVAWEERRAFFATDRFLVNAVALSEVSDAAVAARAAALADAFCRRWPHPQTVLNRSDARSAVSSVARQAVDDIRDRLADLPIGTALRVDALALTADELADLEATLISQVDGVELLTIGDKQFLEKIGEVVGSQRPLISGNQNETSTPRSTRNPPGESIADLIDAGLLAEGDEIFHDQVRKGTSVTARIGPGGKILLGGREFTSPSMALGQATGTSRNGWRDWRVGRTNETLDQLRTRFRRRQS